ncbi:tyrosine-type recombinase/integrase [Vibrio breoganii]
MAVSDSKLKSLNGKKHDKSPIKIADRDGLTIYHRKTGKLSFVFRYRYNGKAQDLSFGTYPILSLSEARAKAIECKRQLLDGHDPKMVRKLEQNKILEAVTVKQALEYWITNSASKARANYEKHQAQFAKHIYPYVGDLPLNVMERRHWSELFINITNGKHHRAAPKASAYILGNCKTALRYCADVGFAQCDTLTVNAKNVAETQGSKSRNLSLEELKEVWDWSHQITSPYYYANLTKLLIVFGCRSQELRLSKVSEWDLDRMVWTVPASHNKIKKKIEEKGRESADIERPIPEALRADITALIEQSKQGYLLGELKSSEAVSTYGRTISKKLNHQPWTFHDLRRTFSTQLNERGENYHAIESLLGHVVSGVAGVYNRATYREQKKAILDRWVADLTETEAESNIVNFR